MTDNSKNKNEESVFRGNEVMMMLEQMSDGIAVIAEEQKELKQNVAVIAEEQKELKQNVAVIAEEQKELKQNVAVIAEEQKELRVEMNEKFDQVFEFLYNIEDELVALRKEIERLKKESATKEELAELDSRVTVLESRFEMANLS